LHFQFFCCGLQFRGRESVPFAQPPVFLGSARQTQWKSSSSA
jgi:hypothetical protein